MWKKIVGKKGNAEKVKEKIYKDIEEEVDEDNEKEIDEDIEEEKLTKKNLKKI